MPDHLGDASGVGGAADTDTGMLTASRCLQGPRQLRAMTDGARRCRHAAMVAPPTAACRRVAAAGAGAVECARSVCAVFFGTAQRAGSLHTHSAVSPAGLRSPVSGGGGGGSGGPSGRMLRARACLAPASAGVRSPWRRVLVLGGAVMMCAGVADAAPTTGAAAIRCIAIVPGV